MGILPNAHIFAAGYLSNESYDLTYLRKTSEGILTIVIAVEKRSFSYDLTLPFVQSSICFGVIL